MVSKNDQIFLSIVSLMGICFFFQTGSGKKLTEQPIDTKIYSSAVLILLFIGILAVILESMLRSRHVATQTQPAAASGKSSGVQALSRREHTLLLGATFAVFLFYCFFFTKIGYFTTGFITLVAYMHVLFYAQHNRLRGWDSARIFVIGIGTTLMLYLIFGKIFELWLPNGLLI